MEQSSSLEILHFRLRSKRSRAQNFDHPALHRHSDLTLSGCAAQNLFTEMPFRLTFPGVLFASVILASIFVAGLGARWEHLTCSHSTPQRRNHKQFLPNYPSAISSPDHVSFMALTWFFFCLGQHACEDYATSSYSSGLEGQVTFDHPLKGK